MDAMYDEWTLFSLIKFKLSVSFWMWISISEKNLKKLRSYTQPCTMERNIDSSFANSISSADSDSSLTLN